MLAAKFGSIFPHLDERQRRLLMGAEARALGHGGIRLVALAAEVREGTVSLGVSELESGAEPLGRARRPGGGRKRAAEVDPGLVPALLALVGPEERGDPMSPLRWTVKSTRTLAAELTRQDHQVSARTPSGTCCASRGSACRATPRPSRGSSTRTGMPSSGTSTSRPRAHQDAGDPVISVDTKKKEQVGEYENDGRAVAARGRPGPGSATTTSPARIRRSRTGSMTWPPTPGG